MKFSKNGLFKIKLLASLLFCAATVSAAPLEPWLLVTATTNNLHGITFGNGIFVAVGDFGTILTSTDGANWTDRRNLITQDNVNLFAVTYGPKGFVAVGGTRDPYRQPVVRTSVDGINWLHVDVTALNINFGNFFQAVTYGNGLYVAAGGNYVTNTVTTSTDGVNWTMRNSHLSNSGLTPLGGVAYGNGIFVAVGADLITSTNGIDWTEQNSSAWYRLYAITFAEDKFVAVGPYSRICSTNGINWTVATPSTADYINGVAYGDGYYLALGYSPCYTTNGTSWTTLTNMLTGNAIAFGNGMFVTVANSGNIYRTAAMPHLSLQRNDISKFALISPFPTTCTIKVCTNLSSSWLPLTTITVTNIPTLWTDSISTNIPMRFYKFAWGP